MSMARLRRIGNYARICMLLLAPIVAAAQARGEMKVYYGLLHAHTLYSDGSGTPAQAYQMAKDTGLDFFAVTPHNHSAAESGAKDRTDGILIATNHDLYNAEGTVEFQPNNQPTRTELSVIAAAEGASDHSFVALYGQEFSTISSGNHVNVFEIDDVLTTENGNFRQLFDLLGGVTTSGLKPLVQLNHPNVQQDLFYNGSSDKTRRKMFNDYGIDDHDLGPEFSNLVAVADPFVGLIEMLSGPAMKKQRPDSFRYHAHYNDYYFYLTQGFHISPSAGQDNHYATWGSVSDVRTGVLCESLSRKKLLAAMHLQRTFATEDKNLDLRFRIESQEMGSTINKAAGADLALEVQIKDTDEPATEYDVKLYYGTVQPQHRARATNWKASDGFQERVKHQGDGTAGIEGYVASGDPEFFYVQVTQDDGDRAWSAPIWINHPRVAHQQASFTWSQTSKVYHLSSCSYAKRIKNNKMSAGEAPPELRPCKRCLPVVEDEEGH